MKNIKGGLEMIEGFKTICSTFKKDDCIYLLKDLTDIIPETSLEEKERMIAQGISYSEMISKEEPVSDEVNEIFKNEMKKNAPTLASLIENISKRMYKIGGENTIIVSLARAGSPIGAAIKRFYTACGLNIPHYSISIIRGKGIDENALNYIREHHPNGKMIFVDGWTGKGSITNELRKAISTYNEKYNTNISSDLVVLADPAKLSKIAGTQEDICISNACLNSTVSGMVSRTIHNTQYIGENEFHGAKVFADLAYQDVTNYFLDMVEKKFTIPKSLDEECKDIEIYNTTTPNYVPYVINKLAKEFPLADINKIKLSIGESSRALLRRKPYVLLLNPKCKIGLDFVTYMAKQKGVPIQYYNTMDYNCIALLQ